MIQIRIRRISLSDLLDVGVWLDVFLGVFSGVLLVNGLVEVIEANADHLLLATIVVMRRPRVVHLLNMRVWVLPVHILVEFRALVLILFVNQHEVRSVFLRAVLEALEAALGRRGAAGVVVEQESWVLHVLHRLGCLLLDDLRVLLAAVGLVRDSTLDPTMLPLHLDIALEVVLLNEDLFFKLVTMGGVVPLD